MNTREMENVRTLVNDALSTASTKKQPSLIDDELTQARQKVEQEMIEIATEEWIGNTGEKGEPIQMSTPTPIPTRRLRMEDIQLYTIGEDITIETLFQSRQSYRFPDFQREFVWTMTDEQLLVDSALRQQFYIPPLDIFEEMTEEGPVRYIVDGGQRFRTFTWFRENRFPTLSEAQFRRVDRNSGLPLIEPNRLFSEMTVMAQNTYKTKTLHLMVTRSHGNATFEQIQPLIAERFRRSCHQRRLSNAEKFWSYPSAAKEAAREISHTTACLDIYQMQGDKRRQRFEVGLTVLALFLRKPPITIQAKELEDIASGLYDSYLTPELLTSIHIFLQRLHHVFYGTRAGSATHIIPMVQACRILESKGIELDACEQGCLTNWFYQARLRSSSQMGRLGSIKAQEYFWSLQHGILLQQPGLVRKA